MKISVKIKTRAKEEKVERIDENNLVVSVKELPIDGKANEAVIKILAEFFRVSASRIEIINGYRSKNKIIEIK